MMSVTDDPPQQNPTIPPGWDDDPSSWGERLPIVGLALVGFCVAMYLSLYQWHVVGHVFEPFFGDGSRHILRESSVSRLSERYLGVPDAFLGAVAYFTDAVAGLIGGRARWRTMPWIVMAQAALVASLAATAVFLVLAQPLLFHAWCTLCLCSAAVSLSMAWPMTRELLASVRHLQRVSRRGGSAWRAIWGLAPESRAEGRVATA